MGRKKKSDLASISRSVRKARESRALQRKLEQLERDGASMESLADIAKERAGTSFGLKDNWNAFSSGVAPLKTLKTIIPCRNKNSAHIPEPLAIEPSLEQEVQESVLDTENVVQFVLDFETEEEMDKRWKRMHYKMS